MKYVFTLVVSLLLACGTLFANGPLLQKLQQITEISDIRELKVPPYSEYYEFWYEQPIDHNNPAKGTFKQRVLLGHRDFKAPMVAILEGYGIYSPTESELSQLFKTNQLTIEHRFFNNSKPAGETPWSDLTLKQAATDQHEIIQSLRQKVYPDTRWISTGISKGGQTTVYHRYFYPEDVEVSVPYVAPINLEKVDPRLEKFLSKLGDTPENRHLLEGGGKETKWQIFDFQKKCFENLNKLLPMLEETARSRGYTFEKAGGTERALKLIIMEFPFAFWQWGNNINDMPQPEVEDFEQIYNYLVRISSPDFFSDQSIRDIEAFYYAALTETGMYAYNIKPFKKYFKEEKDNIITFDFAMPKGYENTPFNTKQLHDINNWLQTKAENMLFIYGGIDPWSATAVDLKKNTKCAKYIKADMDHKCRIKDFENLTRDAILKTLKAWIKGVEVENEAEEEVLFY
ncbi:MULTISPECIES: S28 family serine protease [Butyricimonas]|uniref:S28 family serine protease n=1 Tax=Butyricimonas TaxID=574697 RepID=UPI001D078A25|nr:MULTISPECIES: S28 family serine protease [Butyricimonas]MCB6973527.1 peptidase [Butyricimonas synergistica]MCG4520369.1 peptidase [Butyricimonas sp. DFI.6.44]